MHYIAVVFQDLIIEGSKVEIPSPFGALKICAYIKVPKEFQSYKIAVNVGFVGIII